MRSIQTGQLGRGMLWSLIIAPSFCYAETIPVDSDRWQIQAEESKVETYLGQNSLFLKNGVAMIKDSIFTNGIIEYDVAYDDLTPKFSGVMWRIQGPANFEWFYLRPQHSGKFDSTQYTPYINGLASWQLYYGEGYNALFTIPVKEWIHVKLVIAGQQGEVYLQNLDTPILFLSDLKRAAQPGAIGINVFPGTNAINPSAHFANVSFTEIDNPPLKGTALIPEPTSEGTITVWQVSNVLPESSVLGKSRLTEADKQGLTWQLLNAELPTGIANFSRLQGVSETERTAFARFTIISESEQFKDLNFGAGNRPRVYLNDRLLFNCDDSGRTRDESFRGTVGLHYHLLLPLKQGENEVWVAVTEFEGDVGGWGIRAKLEDLKGITLATPAKPLNLNLVESLGSGCVASYSLDGALWIPCVSVPDNTPNRATIYEANLYQQFPFLIFKVDQDTLVPR